MKYETPQVEKQRLEIRAYQLVGARRHHRLDEGFSFINQFRGLYPRCFRMQNHPSYFISLLVIRQIEKFLAQYAHFDSQAY